MVDSYFLMFDYVIYFQTCPMCSPLCSVAGCHELKRETPLQLVVSLREKGCWEEDGCMGLGGFLWVTSVESRDFSFNS